MNWNEFVLIKYVLIDIRQIRQPAEYETEGYLKTVDGDVSEPRVDRRADLAIGDVVEGDWKLRILMINS